MSVAYMGKVRMTMRKLNPINKDDLKVGDVVGIARERQWRLSGQYI